MSGSATSCSTHRVEPSPAATTAAPAPAPASPAAAAPAPTVAAVVRVLPGIGVEA